MEKLKFKLISNGKELINREVDYLLTNKVINFKIDTSLYKYNLSDNTLIKIDDNNKLTVDITKEVIVIELIKEKYMFDLIIEKLEFINKNNYIEIKYKIIDEDSIVNHIIIEY